MTGDRRTGHPRAVRGQTTLKRNSGFAVLSTALAAVIFYVSLYPFRSRTAAGSPWVVFLARGPSHEDRFDILANILLYAPLGFCLARAILAAHRRTVSRVFRAVVIPIIACALMSLGIELLQFYDVGRASSVWDFCSNAAGGILGAVAGVAITQFSAKLFPAILLLCWIGFRLVSPWTSPQSIPSSVFTLAAQALEMFGAWLGAAVLIESFASVARSRALLAVLIAATIGVPWLVTANRLSSADAAGMAGACAAWLIYATLLARTKNTAVPFVFFWLFVTLDALRPFHFLDEGRHFGMVPFLQLMYGSRESVVSTVFSKVFMYGTLLWTATRAGWSLKRTTLCAATLVLALRMVQVYLPGRTAEITDVLLLLLLAGAMKVMTESSSRWKRDEAVSDAAHGQ